MNGNPYHPMKILKHLNRIKASLKGNICPVFLQLDLTNKCNFNCGHCSSQMYEDYNEYSEAEQEVGRILELLDEAKELGVKAVEITGGGEPTLYSSFVKVMEKIRENFEFSVVTNGSTLMRKEIMESMIGASWIRLSLDASSSQMHSNVHGLNRKSHIFSNIVKAATTFKKMSPRTILGYSFIVMNNNFKEIIKATRIARRSSFDNIRFSAYYSPNGSTIEEKNIVSILDSLNDAEEFWTTETFKVFTFAERIRDIYKEKKTKFCYYSCLVGVISATGIVYPCCAMKNMPEHRIGDIYESSLSDIYRKQKIMTTESCPPCWMNKKNDTIEYMLKPQLHTNFP